MSTKLNFLFSDLDRFSEIRMHLKIRTMAKRYQDFWNANVFTSGVTHTYSTRALLAKLASLAVA